MNQQQVERMEVHNKLMNGLQVNDRYMVFCGRYQFVTVKKINSKTVVISFQNGDVTVNRETCRFGFARIRLIQKLS